MTDMYCRKEDVYNYVFFSKHYFVDAFYVLCLNDISAGKLCKKLVLLVTAFGSCVVNTVNHVEFW